MPKNRMLAVHSRLKHVGFMPQYIARPSPPLQPQEYRPPCHTHLLVEPDHPSMRPLHTLQTETSWNGWMSPITVIKPFYGAPTSPPPHIKPLPQINEQTITKHHRKPSQDRQ